MNKISIVRWSAVLLVVFILSGCLSVKETYTFSPNGQTGTFISSSDEITTFQTSSLAPVVNLSIEAKIADPDKIIGIILWETRFDAEHNKYNHIEQVASTGALSPTYSAEIRSVELSLDKQTPPTPLLIHVETVYLDKSGKIKTHVLDTKYAYWPVPR